MCRDIDCQTRAITFIPCELAENVQLKKVLLSSAEEELRKATRENDSLTPLSATRSRICGNCHKSGHTRPRCISLPCPSHDAYSLRRRQASGAKDIRAAKRNQTITEEHDSEAESKLKALCESRKKASTSLFAVMHPRLKVRNLIKYNDRGRVPDSTKKSGLNFRNFVCRMERYLPPGRTDLVLFLLEHISH